MSNPFEDLKKKENIEVASARIARVLQGNSNEEYLTFLVSPSKAADIIADTWKAEEIGDMDTNGWQYDFWQYYEHEGKKYCLSGSGWYGYLIFRRDRDE
jgi:hypothetical protein